jgi:hypothetical protein
MLNDCKDVLLLYKPLNRSVSRPAIDHYDLKTVERLYFASHTSNCQLQEFPSIEGAHNNGDDRGPQDGLLKRLPTVRVLISESQRKLNSAKKDPAVYADY